MISKERFWIVWCPTGPHSPRNRHQTRREATNEALRLAENHAGQEFFVLEAIGRAQRIDVTWTELDDEVGIPF